MTLAERPAPARVRIALPRAGAALALAELADTPAARRRGLLGRDGLAAGTGLLIRPCSSIHTWFMRFAIDAVFIDGLGTVVKIAHDVKPYRLAWGGWRAKDTLELPAGAARAAGVVVGDRLELSAACDDERAGWR